MKNKKGLFSTVTGFILIAIIVFGLLIFLMIYLNLVQINSSVKKELAAYDVAKQYKNNLLICHRGTFLAAEKLDTEDCPLSSNIKGYSVEQKELFDCETTKWNHGNFDDENNQIIVYNVIILQEDGVSTCSGLLKIYV